MFDRFVLTAISVTGFLVFIGVMYSIKYGLASLSEWGGPDFTMGFVVGGGFIAVVLGIAHWIDQRSSRDVPGDRGSGEKRSDNTIDL